MTDIIQSGPLLSRRGFLKVGLLGAAFLATAGVAASLSNCSASGPASGLAVLRETDMPFLRAVLPVLLEDSVAPDTCRRPWRPPFRHWMTVWIVSLRSRVG